MRTVAGSLLFIMIIGSIIVALLIAVRSFMNRGRRKLLRQPIRFDSGEDLAIDVRESNLGTQKGGDMSDDNLFGRLSRVFRHEAEPPAPQPAPRALPPVEIDYEDSRIPDKAKERVRRILACLTEVQAALAREPLPGFSMVDVEQMQAEHLPKLIKSYIDIPEAHRAEIFRKTGKSASFILNDSLDKMQKRIDDLMRNLAQKDIDAFTNNTRFVGERYSDSNPFD